MTASHEDTANKERLQKILARAGLGSRRACEELIVEGRVTVNGQTVSLLGTRADPFRDAITVDGEKLRLSRPDYWIYNKPEGVFLHDEGGAHRLEELIRGETGRLFTAGRLDRAARGLLLITNDGRIANILTHPRYRVARVYHITCKGSISNSGARLIERALYYAMDGGHFEPLSVIRRVDGKSVVKLTCYAGLAPSIRDIFLKYGHAVRSIQRERIGPIEVGNLEPGTVRKLRGDEVSVLLGYAEAAEGGRLGYEERVVTPADYKRTDEGDDDLRGYFPRKKSGARRTSAGGQKKTSARVHGKSRGPRDFHKAGRPQRRDGERADAGGESRGNYRSERKPRPDGDRPKRFSDRGPRPDGDRPKRFGDRKPRPDGDRPKRFSDRGPRPDGDRPKPYGDRRPRPDGDRPKRFGDRKPRPDGDRPKPYGDRRPRPDGDRPKRFGDRKPRPDGDRPKPYGERRPRPDGDRPKRFGDRKPRPDGDRPKPYGDRRPRPDGDRPKRFGDRKPRPDGDRPKRFGDRKPRPDGDRPKRNFGGPRKPRRPE
jgi:23S rRNA pseudouridine2605 synthase